MTNPDAERPFVPMASTSAMRARARELATPARDDYDRVVLIILDDFDRLLAFYEKART
jgi:hypothetical protein